MVDAAVTKGGTLLAGGVLADAVIFSDVSYLYLALVGAFVSMVGVVHELWGKKDVVYTLSEKLAEMAKGLVIGFFAIPFWYMAFTALAPGLIQSYFGFTPDPSTFISFSLIIAFALSWFTVPIFDFTAKTLPELVKRYVSRLFRKEGE